MRGLETLDWTEILDKLQSLATSEAGRSVLRTLAPLASADQARLSFQQIEEAQSVLLSGARCHMESLDLYGLWAQRLEKGAVLKPLELKDVRHFCLESIALKEVVKPFKSPWLKSIYDRLMDAVEPLSAIDQIMTPEGEIRSDASEDLYKLFRERSQQARAVQQILDRLVKQNDLETILQDRYVTNREGRWVLPVKSGMQHHFDGIIHASSQTKQTVYMEPKEIIPLNNRLRQIEVEIEEEIERLLTALSKYLVLQLPHFVIARDLLLDCDVRFSQGQFATLLEAKPCRFEASELALKNIRHPLLMINNVEVVANSVHLDPKRRILLLSGPNAGGKTVLLKSVGLAAQMARCGLPICSDDNSSLPFFTDLLIAVGDAQSVDAQLSTFAAHLSTLNQAAKCVGSGYLLLIDEICGSTDPEEGSALARSFLEAFAKNETFAVVTSHLSPLKLGWGNDSGVINGSLEYDAKSGRPTYHFLMGVPGQSLAIQTARRVGVENQIIERALSHLSPETKRYQMGLSEVDQMKEELSRLRDELLAEKRQMNKEKSKFLALQQKFDRDKGQMLEQAVKRAEKKIDQLIEHSKVEDVFRRHEKLENTKFDLPEIIKASTRAQSGPKKIESADEFSQAFPPGSKVFATALGKDAVVQGKPNNRGEVPILANSMRLMVSWDQLRPPQQGRNPTMDVVRRAADVVTSPLEGDRVIDIRGLNVEEATHLIDTQLDQATLRDEDRVKIVHGHGTEALKRGVRNFLSRSLYVKKWTVGTAETGGDGVTWVELKD